MLFCMARDDKMACHTLFHIQRLWRTMIMHSSTFHFHVKWVDFSAIYKTLRQHKEHFCRSHQNELVVSLTSSNFGVPKMCMIWIWNGPNFQSEWHEESDKNRFNICGVHSSRSSRICFFFIARSLRKRIKTKTKYQNKCETIFVIYQHETHTENIFVYLLHLFFSPTKGVIY